MEEGQKSWLFCRLSSTIAVPAEKILMRKTQDDLNTPEEEAAR